MNTQGWIGVDFDGTLAEYRGWKGELHFGKPIPAIVERIKYALDLGYDVKIMTARACVQDPERLAEIVAAIHVWLTERAGLPALEVTASKDYQMVELWDDRAVQVKHNTGKFVGKSSLGIG